jgi:hypothetical protein
LCTQVLESHFPPSPQLFWHSPKPATDSFHCYILVRTPISPNVWLIVLIPAQASYLTKPVCEDSNCKWHFPPTPQLIGHSPKPCSQTQPITEELWSVSTNHRAGEVPGHQTDTRHQQSRWHYESLCTSYSGFTNPFIWISWSEGAFELSQLFKPLRNLLLLNKILLPE